MRSVDARRAVLCSVAVAAPWAYLGLVRPWQLRWGATPAEAHRDLPGDDLVPHPMFEATRAVTIGAPPGQVWPWIVQMGYGRAGFYAIDLLDNGGRRSAGHIVPELQHLAVGQVIPTGPNGAGFTVTRLDPERLLVLHVPRAAAGPARGAVVVTITLEPVRAGATRLLSRLRADSGPEVASRLYGLLLEAGDFVMMRLMLTHIKARAEAEQAQARAATAVRADAGQSTPPPGGCR